MSQVKESPDADSSHKPLASWYTQGLSDGLGDRLLMFDNTGAPSLELLRFRPDVGQAPGFETALRDQVDRLGQFQHPAFAPVRSVQRLEPDDDLALISNYTPGKRLSEVLHHARGLDDAAALIRQLAPALLLLQQHAGAHGVLSPDRIVVSPDGRLTIVEHVVGPAIDALNLQASELASMGIALPPAAGSAPRLDVATDWYQFGLLALSVLIGRPVTASELPELETLLDELSDPARPGGPALSPVMRQWLDRTLQISGGRIESGADARAALDELLEKEPPRKSRQIESPVVPPARHSTRDREPSLRLVAPPPSGPQPAQTPTQTLSPFELSQREARERPTQMWTRFNGYSILETKKRSGETEREGVVREAPAAGAARPLETRSKASTRVIAALAVIAVLEAVVIASMARVLWRTPAVLVETAPTGESVLVTRRSGGAAPLRLTVAPDLQWVRVVSPSSADAPGGPAADASYGTIRISSPIELKVFEQSRLLGSVPGAGLQLSAGRHDIELVNQGLGYRLRQTVEVEAGGTLSIHVAPPHGWVTLNAMPDADVSIDGQRVGRTPLGPLPLAIGEHSVTFQHTSGAKDRKQVTVKSGAIRRVVGYPRR